MPKAIWLTMLLAAATAMPSAAAEPAVYVPEGYEHSAAVDALVFPGEPAGPLRPYHSPMNLAYFSTEAVALRRSTDDSFPIAALNNGGVVVLSTGELDFSHEPGLRVLAGLQLTDNLAVEASYLGLYEWDDTRSVRNQSLNAQATAGDLFSPFTGFGNPADVGFDFNNFVAARTNTQFNNVELNLRQHLYMPYSTVRCDALYGLRYANVQDRFEYRSLSAAPLLDGTAGAVDVEASNAMFGPQLGGAMEFHIERRAWIRFEGKAAGLYNHAGRQTDFAFSPLAGPAAFTTDERSQGRLAFVGDIEASCIWSFTPSIVGRVGYQAIFIDGVALGSQNFSSSASALGADGAEVVRNGNLTFHGPFAGLTVTW